MSRLKPTGRHTSVRPTAWLGISKRFSRWNRLAVLDHGLMAPLATAAASRPSGALQAIDAHILHRLRAIIIRQRKRPRFPVLAPAVPRD